MAYQKNSTISPPFDCHNFCTSSTAVSFRATLAIMIGLSLTFFSLRCRAQEIAPGQPPRLAADRHTDPKIAKLIEGVSTDRIRETIEKLVSFQNRSTISAQNEESIKAGKWPDPEAIRFPTNHTIILALNKKDLPQTASDPSVGVDHLITPLRAALNERIAPGAQVWAAGYAEDWEKTLALTYMAALPQKNRDVVRKIQTFAVSFLVNNDVTFHADFQCQDEASAQALGEYLGNEKIIGLTDLKTSQKETWASIQAKAADLASLSKLLRIPNGSLSIDDRKSGK